MDELQELLDQHDYDVPQVGDIRQGIIVAINQQGVIVDLGLKRDGLVPTTDLAKLEEDEREALAVNDEVFVYILNTDKPDSLTISINLARLNQDWIEAEELLESGKIIVGEIIGYNKGGAIVPFGRLRGFVPISHLSELSPGMGDRKRQQRLAKLRGQELPLKVIEVNRRRRRLVFSQREAQKEWDAARRLELLNELNEGDIRVGTVSGLRDFGAFVNLGGADGLIHISELAWHRVDHPREVLKVGDEIEVYIMRVDRESERISLSRKKVLQNPWVTVNERYSEGQLIEGSITRIVDYGAFAEVEPGIEGLLHISQLSRGNIENPGEVVQEGEQHLLRIVNIDKRRQRMGLSLKAVTAMEQIEWMEQREIEKAAEEAAAELAAAESKAAEEIIEEDVVVETVVTVEVDDEGSTLISDEVTKEEIVTEVETVDEEGDLIETVVDEVIEEEIVTVLEVSDDGVVEEVTAVDMIEKETITAIEVVDSDSGEVAEIIVDETSVEEVITAVDDNVVDDNIVIEENIAEITAILKAEEEEE